MSKPYYVYLLRCIDGSLYAGITTDVKRRFAEHLSGSAKGSVARKSVTDPCYFASIQNLIKKVYADSSETVSPSVFGNFRLIIKKHTRCAKNVSVQVTG